MMRPWLRWKTRSMTGPISPSEVVKPGTSALVESTMNRSTPSSPSRAKARRSVMRPSSGSWSILKSPVCSTMPAGVRIATASASGIEWLTATNSRSKGPNAHRVALGDLVLDGLLEPVLLQLRAQQRQGQLGAHERDVAALAQEVRRRADVVLVTVGEHQRLDAVEPVPDRLEVGEDQVDAGVVLLGEQHAAVDDQQPVGVLEDGHVAPDVAEAAQRGDPQRVLRDGPGVGEVVVEVGHGGPSGGDGQMSPEAASPARSASTSASSSATSGPRTVRLSSTPSSCRAALEVVAP